MNFIEKNNKERLAFVDSWSKYVLTHDDKTWSRQQNKIINSCLRYSTMTKKQFLKMKQPTISANMKPSSKIE